MTAEDPGFAMVTRPPNELVVPVHAKPMVTIIAPEHQERWLTGSRDDVTVPQRPYAAERMVVRGPVFPDREAPSIKDRDAECSTKPLSTTSS